MSMRHSTVISLQMVSQMVRRKTERDDLIRRIALQGGAKWLQLQAVWRRWPPLDLAQAGRLDEPVTFSRILCWWCRTYHSPDEVKACMALPRRNDSSGASGLSTSKPQVGQLLSQYSELLAFLMLTTWPDGKRRLTGRLSLSCEPTGWKLSAADEESGQYATLTGLTPDDLFLAFEAGLSDGTLPWRASKYQSHRPRK